METEKRRYLEYAITNEINLQTCLVDGKIDLDLLVENVKKEQLEKYVSEQHNYAIMEDSRGWVTSIKDETRPEKRIKVRRKKREDLIEFLADFFSHALQKSTGS